MRMRSFTSTVSMSCAFSSTGASRFAATRSASAPGAWMESMSEPASRGSSGMSWMTCFGDVAQAHRRALRPRRPPSPAHPTRVILRLEVRRVWAVTLSSWMRVEALQDQRGSCPELCLSALRARARQPDRVEVVRPGIVRRRIALREDLPVTPGPGGCRRPPPARPTSRGRRRTGRRRHGNSTALRIGRTGSSSPKTTFFLGARRHRRVLFSVPWRSPPPPGTRPGR